MHLFLKIMSIKQNQKRTKIAIQTSFRRSFANEAVLSMVLFGLCTSRKECSGQDFHEVFFFSFRFKYFYRKQIEIGFIWFPKERQLTSTTAHVLLKKLIVLRSIFRRNYDFFFNFFFLQMTWEAQTPQMWTHGYKLVALLFHFNGDS